MKILSSHILPLKVFAVIAASGAAVAAAGVSGCFKDVALGNACDLGSCDTAGWCSTPEIIINETLYTVESPGKRKKATEMDALCLKMFQTYNDDGFCNELHFCQSVLSGHRAHGGICMESGPI